MLQYKINCTRSNSDRCKKTKKLKNSRSAALHVTHSLSLSLSPLPPPMASLSAAADELIAAEMARHPRPKGRPSRPSSSSSSASSASSVSSSSSSAAATRDPRAEPIADGELRLSYLASELINLEIMKRHDGNLWRAHNQDVAQSAAATAQAVETLERGIKAVNKKRAAEADKAEAASNKRRKSVRDRLLALGELQAAVASR
jgi:hypothetical protein